MVYWKESFEDVYNFKFLNFNNDKNCKQFSENIETKKTILRAKTILQKMSDIKLDVDMTKIITLSKYLPIKIVSC